MPITRQVRTASGNLCIPEDAWRLVPVVGDYKMLWCAPVCSAAWEESHSSRPIHQVTLHKARYQSEILNHAFMHRR